ncbi:MAG: adenylate/guanylate cyclase domain-containing protein [Planctomycetota bacterium]|nr:adenylate/guanylate cyclase domain-containing protein [Planctomycetota bacterium]
MGRIRILNGPNRNQTVEINGGEVAGRDPGSEIQIFAPGVSRRHFQFTCEGTDTILADLNSANGTYVNNVRITKLVLSDRDMIIVGGIQLQFHADSAPPIMAPPEFNPDNTETISGPEVGGGIVMREEDDDDDEDFDATLLAGMIMTDVSVDKSKGADEAIKSLQKRLRITYEVSDALGSVSDTAELFKKIMELLFQAFPQTNRGLIMVGDDVTTLVPAIVAQWDGKQPDEIPVSRTILKKVFGGKQSILTEDAASDVGAQMSIINLQLSSLMCVPLLFQDEALGVIQIDGKPRARFTEDDLKLLTGIAGQAAIFLKNVSLFQLVEKEAEARTNLQRYFSPDLADKVVNGEIDLKPGGDMKVGTVFFSDIIGFTAMSNSMGPMEVINKINRYFKIMVDIIFKYNGYIDKFGGDAIMAVWGVPVEVEEEALSAITAAVEMQNALLLFNLELNAEGHSDIQMGIGLNSGNFIAGNLGSEKRMEYTVIGDNVNLSSRVESKAGRGNVFISPACYERAEKKPLVIRLQPTELKGIPQPVPIYSVRGVPTKQEDVYLMSLPFFVDGNENQEGLLVKAKDLGDGRVLALVLMKHKVTTNTVNLKFIQQEMPSFTLALQIQREVPLQNKLGACYNGVLVIKDTCIEQLIKEGEAVSEKRPDDLPRGKEWGK